MPAKRSSNLRGGDLAEGAGIQSLRSFSAVAPVPREEDIGIDVVCTLLRPEGKLLYAEDSFFVQIKSASVSEIIYKHEEYTWLCELLLPIFIARIDRKCLTTEIFSMQRVFTRASKTCKGVKVYLGESNSVAEQDIDFIPLGCPILKWNWSEESQPKFRDNTYQIMKIWVAHEQKGRLLREAYRCQEFDWDTNELPQIGSTRISADDKDLKNLLVNIAPILFPLIDSLMGQLRSGGMGETDVNRSIDSILNLDKLVRKYDAQTDPEPVGLLVMLKHLTQHMKEEGMENELPQVFKDLGLQINKTSKKKSVSKGFGKT